MTKALVLLANQGERSLARAALRQFKEVEMPATAEGALDLILRNEAFDLVVIDERIDQVLVPVGKTGIFTQQLLQAHREKNPKLNSLVVIVMNERSGLVEKLKLADMGTDIFIQRPFSVTDFQERMASFWPTLVKMPANLLLTRSLRAMVKAGQFNTAVSGLEQVCAANPDDVSLTLMLASAYSASDDGERRGLGLKMLQKLDRDIPACPPVKEFLRTAYQACGQHFESFSVGVELFCLDMNDERFVSCMEVARRMREAHYLPHWLGELEKLDSSRTRKWRTDVLKQMSKSVCDFTELSALLTKLEKHRDVHVDIADDLVSVGELFKDVTPDHSHVELYKSFLRLVLNVDPGSPILIEAFTMLSIQGGENEKAMSYLMKARELKKFSKEYFRAAIEMSFADGQLKEASELIHAARRFAPSESVWDNFSQKWNVLYSAKQQAA